ncbi:MAG: DUF1566 domain-containing protein [Desulfobacterales bacterium]
MDRENFYLLLNLGLDPPETDPKKIEAAINRMRATWSRYRNHPSKGIQAKKFIGMIPEIRKVMEDPYQRHKEAEKALDILKQRKREKFVQVDRHLRLRMSKGFITDQEITKLAEMNKLSEDSLRQRLRELEAEKYSAIDENIRLRMAKGFVTESEISSIAKRYGIKPLDVRKRVNVPIRKDSEAAADDVQRLDRSIAQNISDSLKVVGKSDLYDFLDLKPTVNKEQLLIRIQQKEAEIQNIGKKDAMVTASGSLVGLCASVFKSEESRRGYDMLLAHSRLSRFDADIDVAGMDNQIRAEYFEILVERGTEFGMDRDEAAKYITDYCQKKGWEIVTPEAKKPPAPKRRVMPLILILIIVLAAGGVYLWRQKATQTEREFRQIIQRASQVTDPQERVDLYQTYLSSHSANEFSSQIEQKLNADRDLIQKRAFQAASREASLVQSDSLEAALEILEAYLAGATQSNYTRQAQQQIDTLKAQIDERDYRQALIPQETQAKMSAYRNYMDTHPQGKYLPEIKKRLIEMGEEYYLFIKNKIKAAQRQEAWSESLDWVQSYLDVYAENSHTMELKELHEDFSTRVRDSRAFKVLKAKSQALDSDLNAARQVFSDYLSAYPDTTIKKKVEAEISQLSERMQQSRIDDQAQRVRSILDDAGARFSEKTEGVISDTQTGLMWTLLDSKQLTTQCFNYVEAMAHVAKLDTGNYSDWRLPTLSEIRELYAADTTFPAETGEWFWTGDKYTRYADGWITEVRTLEKRQDNTWSPNKHDARDCGLVRAVRP